ncbi:MAG: hypothetical protein ABII23_01335 [bacterium]
MIQNIKKSIVYIMMVSLAVAGMPSSGLTASFLAPPAGNDASEWPALVTNEKLEKLISINFYVLRRKYTWIKPSEMLWGYAFEGINRALKKFDSSRGVSIEAYLRSKGILEARDRLISDGVIHKKSAKARPKEYRYFNDEDEDEDEERNLFAHIFADSKACAGIKKVENEEILKIIEDTCSPAALFILEEYYNNHLKMKDIADMTGISMSRVSQLHRQIINMISNGETAQIDFGIGKKAVYGKFGERINIPDGLDSCSYTLNLGK